MQYSAQYSTDFALPGLVLFWAGRRARIVSAYFLVSTKRVTGINKIYQAMNLLGAIGVGVNVFHQHAWPAFALQIVWGIIAIVALVKK